MLDEDEYLFFLVWRTGIGKAMGSKGGYGTEEIAYSHLLDLYSSYDAARFSKDAGWFPIELVPQEFASANHYDYFKIIRGEGGVIIALILAWRIVG